MLQLLAGAKVRFYSSEALTKISSHQFCEESNEYLHLYSFSFLLRKHSDCETTPGCFSYPETNVHNLKNMHIYERLIRQT